MAGRIEDYAIVGEKNTGVVRQMSAGPCQARNDPPGHDTPDSKVMMPSGRHILIVNARKVHQPVFVIGAPHSGAEPVGRALKISPGFHVTIGQPPCCRPCTRSPGGRRCTGRTQAAAAVIRDAFAQGWQVTATSCLECTPQCRSAAGLAAEGGRAVRRAARPGAVRRREPGPHLLRGGAVGAFPDAQIVQVVRDGRDTVADMLNDQVAMSWFRPSMVNVDIEYPNPFYGVEDETDRLDLAGCPPRSARCAGEGHQAGRPAAQEPAVRAAQDAPLRGHGAQPGGRPPRCPASPESEAAGRASPRRPHARPNRRGAASVPHLQVADIEKVAGEELRRLG